MRRIRLHLGNLSVPELITYARRVQSALRNNPAFAVRAEELALLGEEIIELVDRHDEHEEAVRLVQERLAERNLIRGSVEALLGDLAEDVAELALNHPSVVAKSGFEPRVFKGVNADPTEDVSSTVYTFG